MKIKCPDCKKELENSDPNTLVNEYASHCAFDHPQISCGRFARQEFKIHEKIESFEYSENCRLADAYTGLQPDKVSKVLKSLLY